jgi:hypothetical protein
MMLAAAMWLAAGAATVEVRATRETAPCVAAALAASGRWRTAARLEAAGLREPGAPDLLVASEVELTRALESGAAEANSDVDLARIPWVLRGAAAAQLAAASPLPARAVALPEGPASYEARRALRAAGSTVVEAADVRALKDAPLALVPLSLAGEGPHVPAATVPPLVARAALGTRATRSAAAPELLRYLASEAGQRAFAACK